MTSPALSTVFFFRLSMKASAFFSTSFTGIGVTAKDLGFAFDLAIASALEEGIPTDLSMPLPTLPARFPICLSRLLDAAGLLDARSDSPLFVPSAIFAWVSFSIRAALSLLVSAAGADDPPPGLGANRPDLSRTNLDGSHSSAVWISSIISCL